MSNPENPKAKRMIKYNKWDFFKAFCPPNISKFSEVKSDGKKWQMYKNYINFHPPPDI